MKLTWNNFYQIKTAMTMVISELEGFYIVQRWHKYMNVTNIRVLFGKL